MATDFNAQELAMLTSPYEIALLDAAQKILAEETNNGAMLPESSEGVIAQWTISALESLSRTRLLSERRRVMLKKHEWHERANGTFECLECHAIYLPDNDDSAYVDEISIPGRMPIINLGKGKVHLPDCAYAAALKGE